MSDEQLRNYKILKRHYKRLLQDGHEPSDLYLCLNDKSYAELTELQVGYMTAIERTPVPKAKTCEGCGTELPLPEDTTQKDIDAKVEAYRAKLEKKYE